MNQSTSYEIDDAQKELIEAIKDELQIVNIFGFRDELRARLDMMCKVPTYRELSAWFGDVSGSC